MIALLISQPWISQNELAAHFGMSASWISTIICSDLFQTKLAEKRDELVDPELRTSIKAQMEGLHSRSMDILRKKLEREPDQVPDQLALQVAKVMGQGLGYGSKETKISVHETHVHLEELGSNLVGLLRRRRAEADGEIINGEVLPSKPANGSHPQQVPSAAPGAGAQQPEDIPLGEAAEVGTV